MSGRSSSYPVIPGKLLMPTGRELTEARAQLARGDGAFSSSYVTLGVAVSGTTGAIIRALRLGDVDAAAAGLRKLAALDLAAAEVRARIVEAERAAEAAPRPRRLVAVR